MPSLGPLNSGATNTPQPDNIATTAAAAETARSTNNNVTAPIITPKEKPFGQAVGELISGAVKFLAPKNFAEFFKENVMGRSVEDQGTKGGRKGRRGAAQERTSTPAASTTTQEATTTNPVVQPAPTQAPTTAQTGQPTTAPSAQPTQDPTPAPTQAQTGQPTPAPTSASPTTSITAQPTQDPTSAQPTQAPTSASPTPAPTKKDKEGKKGGISAGETALATLVGAGVTAAVTAAVIDRRRKNRDNRVAPEGGSVINHSDTPSVEVLVGRKDLTRTEAVERLQGEEKTNETAI